MIRFGESDQNTKTIQEANDKRKIDLVFTSFVHRKSFPTRRRVGDIFSNDHIARNRRSAQVKCEGNARESEHSIGSRDLFNRTLKMPAARIGCNSSSCKERFRSIFSIESFTARVLATLRKIPVVSGPLI